VRKRLIFAAKIAITILLCALLLRAADWRAVLQQARDVDRTYLALAVLLFIPQTLISAWRWKVLVRPVTHIGLVEATREILAASALNMVVPAKLGDFSKAAMLPNVPPGRGKEAAIRAVVEKLSDVGMLLISIGLGRLALIDATWSFAAIGALAAAFALAHGRLVRRRGSSVLLPFVALTLVSWCVQFTQLHLFLVCCGVEATISQTLQRVPLAIFAGLVPAAFCGIGTRDAALVYLFADIADSSRMAVVGMLTALRYLVPGAIGIPLLWAQRREQSSQTAAAGRSPVPDSATPRVANRHPRPRAAVPARRPESSACDKPS
jgi:uncharacterized membrane protein YbhN (UPF0104 family)